jgi:outer membrane protein TolC
VRAWRRLILAISVLAAPAAGTAAGPLPSPLTLEQALALADDAHPDLALAQARLAAHRARLDQARAFDGVRSSLELTAQTVNPSTEANFDLTDDSRARLLLQKRLYDFGYSRALTRAARGELASRELSYLDVRQGRRLEIMARYFDVLLADLRYAVDTEAMTVAYLAFDRGRERHRLGQLSDLDLLELEHRYQENRLKRTESQKRQVSSRQQLAHTLNRPDERPGELATPELPGNERELPVYEPLLQAALERNPVLAALRAETEAARATVAAERARRKPVVSAELEAGRWARELQSRDDFRAALTLRVPIYDGGEEKATIAAAEAALGEREARFARAELELRQTVLDLVQELETLKVAREVAKVRTSYRDLYLDRSRALYELEVRTDLGDAQTRNSEAQWLAAQVEFRLALVWARIEALTGALAAGAAKTESQEKQP